MSEGKKYRGNCFCDDVRFTVTGQPELMAYCHCESCRTWAASPISAFTLWNPAAVEITKGLDNIAGFDKNQHSGNDTVISNRVWCKTCGGHLYTDHPTMGLIDVPATLIKEFSFEPVFHVHYQESIQPMKDGLPKFKDLPKEAGGSGETITEFIL